MKDHKVKFTFITEMLGTAPSDPEIYEKFIMKNAAVVEDELETLEVADPKAITIFHKVDGQPIIYDYMIRGFLKHACGAMRRLDDTLSKDFTAYKKKIDQLVFVFPRRIPILKAGEITTYTRPLRAMTPKGPRVSLAKSEMIQDGAELDFTIKVLGVISDELLREWLDYGCLNGIGQFRNGSFGRFTYEIVE